MCLQTNHLIYQLPPLCWTSTTQGWTTSWWCSLLPEITSYSLYLLLMATLRRDPGQYLACYNVHTSIITFIIGISVLCTCIHIEWIATNVVKFVCLLAIYNFIKNFMLNKLCAVKITFRSLKSRHCLQCVVNTNNDVYYKIYVIDSFYFLKIIFKLRSI